MHNFLKVSVRAGTSVVQQADLLLVRAQLEQKVERMVDASSVKELDTMTSSFSNASGQVKFLASGMSKAAQVLKGHADGLKRKEQRTAKLKAKLAERRAI